jgi:hypothetical protein
MSHLACQRAVVRMLYDPEFQRAVYADPAAVLAGLDLSADERAWLVRPDPRAWGTDPYRRSRALRGLLEEYPTSAWLVARNGGEVRRLSAFFSSPCFHRCIDQRGSLALSFGEYLEERARAGMLGDGRLVPLARLEHAIARVRREIPAPAAARPPGESWLGLSSRHAALALPAGTLALAQAIRAFLGGESDVVQALLSASTVAEPPGVRDATCSPSEDEHLLVERAARPPGEVTIESVSPELAQVLLTAARGAPRADLLAAAERGGATAEEARDVVDGLTVDGVLVAR